MRAGRQTAETSTGDLPSATRAKRWRSQEHCRRQESMLEKPEVLPKSREHAGAAKSTGKDKRACWSSQRCCWRQESMHPDVKTETPFLLQCLSSILPDWTLATNRVQVHLTELNTVLSKGPTPIFIAQSVKDKFESSKVFFSIYCVYIILICTCDMCVVYVHICNPCRKHGQSQVFPHSLSTLVCFLERGLSLKPELTDWLDWLLRAYI